VLERPGRNKLWAINIFKEGIDVVALWAATPRMLSYLSLTVIFVISHVKDKHPAETGDVRNAMDEKRTQVPPELPPTGEC
jgi:hypothetical protein